jgi:tetratricopeptide (TPR) repeat protein
MRKYMIALLWICSFKGVAQQRDVDSLRQVLLRGKEDTNRVLTLRNLARAYFYYHLDSSYYFASQGLRLAQKIQYRKGEAFCMSELGSTISYSGNYPRALGILLKALQLAEQISYDPAIADALNSLGALYYFEEDYRKSLEYFLRSLPIVSSMKDEFRESRAFGNIGDAYFRLRIYDSAIYYSSMAYRIAKNSTVKEIIPDNLNNLAKTYVKLNRDSVALGYFRLAIPVETETHDEADFCESNMGMAGIFRKQNKMDSALLYGYRSMTAGLLSHFAYLQLDATNFIASVYESEKNSDSALKYLKLTIALKDSLYSQEKSKSIQNLTFEENVRQQEIADQKKKAEEDAVKNLQLLAIAVFIPIFFLIVLLLSRTKVKARVVEFLAIVCLLMVFEFITDLIFPFISDWTKDNPVWEMVILVLIAALLEPVNYRVEHWIKNRLVHKPAFVPLPI